MKIINLDTTKTIATLRPYDNVLYFNHEKMKCKILGDCWEFKTTRHAPSKISTIIKLEDYASGFSIEYAIKPLVVYLVKKLKLNNAKIVLCAETEIGECDFTEKIQ